MDANRPFTSLTKCAENVRTVLSAGIVPMIYGNPGIGKSDLVKDLAKEYNLYLIDWRGTTAEPTDVTGYPEIVRDEAGKPIKSTYVPFDTFPVMGDTVPEGYNGWLIFADELPNAPRDVQNAMYKLILDRMVGQKTLHPEAFIVAAGNMEESGCYVNPIGQALKSRMINLYVNPSLQESIDWGANNGVHNDLLTFMAHKPSLFEFSKETNKAANICCPRTYMGFLNSIYTELNYKFTSDNSQLLMGTIGSIATELIGYLKYKDSLIDFTEIEADPRTATIPDNPANRYMTCGMLAEKVNKDNGSLVHVYLNRMGKEYAAIVYRMAIPKNPDLVQVPEIMDWVNENAHMIRK